MPNHVTNTVCIQGINSDILKVKNFLLDGKNPFDFNKVAKMPEDKTNGAYCDWGRANWGTKWNSYSHQETGAQLFVKAMLLYLDSIKIKLNKDQEKIKNILCSSEESNFKIGIELMKSIDMPKEFSILNSNNLYYQFETAWNRPFRVFEKLSSMFPDVKITVAFADEDIGSNCGVMEYKKGVELVKMWSNDKNKDYEKEQYIRFACILNKWDYEDFITEED